MREKTSPMAQDSFDSVALLLHQILKKQACVVNVIIPTNLVSLLFDSFILQFYSIVFILVSILFYCCQRNLSMPSYMVCLFNSQWSINRRWEMPKFAHACKIRSHAPHVPVPGQSIVAQQRSCHETFGRERNFELCW